MNFPKLFSRIIKNQLVSGGSILFLGSLLGSAAGYVYHLLMGRMLGPIDYGILASLFSLCSIFSIPTSSLSLVIVRQVSALRGKKKLGEISFYYSWILRKFMVFGFFLFLVLMIFSLPISKFLRIESMSLILIAIISSIFGIFMSINNSILQSFLRFKLLSFLGVLITGLKLVIAVVLVLLSFRVVGAMSAVLISSVVGLLVIFPFVKKLLPEKPKKFKINSNKILKYAIPVFLSTLAFTSMYTVDVVLARHFLSGQEAGFYASLSTLGKIIFFASGPISAVMFPMVAERHANGENYINLLVLAFAMVVLICLGTSSIYFLFPSLMVSLLFGKLFLDASYALGFFALFMSLYSLSYLLVSFSLSIKRTKVVVFPAAAAILQVGLIFLFHKSMVQIVGVSIVALGLLLTSLVFYSFIKDKRVVAQLVGQFAKIRN